MDSTPLKKKRLELIDLSDDEDAVKFFQNYSTPNSIISQSSSSSSLCSPLDKLNMLTPINRDDMDAYINRVKNKTFFQSIRKDFGHSESQFTNGLAQFSKSQNVGLASCSVLDQQLDFEDQEEGFFSDELM